MISEAIPSATPGPTELQRRYQETIAAVDEQLRHNPDNIELLRRKARALLAIGENDQALASYDAILQAHPQDIQALVEKADLLLWLGRYDQALTFYDQALEFDSRSAEVLHKKGLVLRMLGQLDVALACYDRALQIDSRDPRIWWGKGDVFLEQSQFSSAFDCYSKGDAVDSKKAYGGPAWTERGDRLLDSGDSTDALFCYKRATQIDPNYLWGWRGMGVAFRALQKYEQALEWFDRALALDSKGDSRTATVWAEKGNTLLDLMRYSEASACYQKALEIEPENLEALINQGVVRQDEGNYKEAIGFYDRALAIDDQRLEVWQNKGFCLGVLEKNEEGIQCYDRVLQSAADSIWAWNNKGYLLTVLGKRDEALLCFDKAIAIDESQILPWRNKGITLRDLKRYPEAEECLKRALELVKDNNEENEVLMDLGALLGDYKYDHEGALKVYQRVLVIRPEADVQANIAECLIELGRYEEARQAVLNTQSNEEPLSCIIAYLIVASYGLEGDSANFESSFKRFLSHFEQRNDGQGLRVGANDWNYRSLLNTIAQKSPDLRTRFLLSVSIDLQIGNIEPSKLAFFKPFPAPQESG